MDNVWGIILAAGASTRMKKQKMLLPFNGKTIIETVIEIAAGFLNNNVVVVVGSQREKISEQIKDYNIKIAVNRNYREGMLSSVICGMKALPGNTRAMLVFLGDQPQIPANITEKVVHAWKKSSKGICIPAINGKRGHPVLIDSRYFREIEKLNPDKGLRELSVKYKNDVLLTACNYAEILRDIDTPEEYEFEINKLQPEWKK